MSQINPGNIIEALQWRYATKRFDPSKKIAEHDWKILVESLRLAPSSYGLQPWKFLVIETPELREKLRPAAWNQSQVTDASHFVVFTYKTKIDEEYVSRFINATASTRSLDPTTLAPYRAMMEGALIHGPGAKNISFWSQRQAYLALGVLLETAALMHIDACPLEGIEPMQFDNILGLEGTGYLSVCAAALGYRHPEDKYQHLPKVRFPAAEVIEYR